MTVYCPQAEVVTVCCPNRGAKNTNFQLTGRLTCFTVAAHEADGAAALVAAGDDPAGSVVQARLMGHALVDLDLAIST